MPTKTINQDNTDDIDLGNSNSMTITAVGGNASVHVDYKLNGSFSSAVRVGRAAMVGRLKGTA